MTDRIPPDAPKKKLRGFAVRPDCINRKGRLPSGQTIAEITRAWLAEKETLTQEKKDGTQGATITATREEFLRKGLFKLAMGSPDHSARIRATEALMDRAYGKPPIPLTGDEDGGPIRLIFERTTT